MKAQFIISLVIVVAAVIITVSIPRDRVTPPVMVFGAVCCMAGLFSLVMGAIFALSKQKESARALLLAAGITFLIGTGACSTLLFAS